MIKPHLSKLILKLKFVLHVYKIRTILSVHLIEACTLIGKMQDKIYTLRACTHMNARTHTFRHNGYNLYFKFIFGRIYILNLYMYNILNMLTVSASLWCSIKAENSTSLNLCVAIARPSHGGGGGAWRPPTSPEETAVAGFPAGYDVCGKGFTLKKNTL